MSARDPRLRDLLGAALDDGASPRAVLLGFPSDEGVRRNGGRPGAAAAPEAIRARLRALTPDAETPAMRSVLERTADLGNVEVTGEVERDQERLGEALAAHVDAGTFVIVLGGGHETAYGHFLGYVAANRSPEILNWDAHADVRELKQGRAHSGSPFRQAVQHPSGACRRYSVAGLLPHSAAADHVRFVREQGVLRWRSELAGPDAVGALYPELAAPAMVSFDLDAVDQAHAPGVSAPATGGLTPEVWLRAARLAGRAPAVASVDVVELCPRLDVDDRTTRLAALTVWQVLRGLAERDAR